MLFEKIHEINCHVSFLRIAKLSSSVAYILQNLLITSEIVTYTSDKSTTHVSSAQGIYQMISYQWPFVQICMTNVCLSICTFTNQLSSALFL